MNIIMKVIVFAWLGMTACEVVGKLIGWREIARDKRPASHYLRRVLLSDAYNAVGTFIGVVLFREGLYGRPIFSSFKVILSALVVGATWGWLAYCRGWINGGFDVRFWKRFI